MTDKPKNRINFRLPNASTCSDPLTVADNIKSTIIATAEVAAPLERVLGALTTNELERWWGHPNFYRQTGWIAESRISGQLIFTISFADSDGNSRNAEFAEIDAPCRLVVTGKLEKHPRLGTRETTVTYRLHPVEKGTRVTVCEEGFMGRSGAAYGNAERWEEVLGWLDVCMKAYVETEPHADAFDIQQRNNDGEAAP